MMFKGKPGQRGESAVAGVWGRLASFQGPRHLSWVQGLQSPWITDYRLPVHRGRDPSLRPGDLFPKRAPPLCFPRVFLMHPLCLSVAPALSPAGHSRPATCPVPDLRGSLGPYGSLARKRGRQLPALRAPSPSVLPELP